MKLDSYLSLSRHGIFYFRWPLPLTTDQPKRTTIRISLRTRCRVEAGNAARQLALDGWRIRENKELQRLRYDEMRRMVRQYFEDRLATFCERINENGPRPERVAGLEQNIEFLEDAIQYDDYSIADEIISPDHFRKLSGISDSHWEANENFLKSELRKGQRDLYKRFVELIREWDQYDFSPSAKAVVEAQTPEYPTLSVAIRDYLAENSRSGGWTDRTANKNKQALEHLIEIFGPERRMETITRQDATEAKKLMMALPSRRKTLPQTRELDIREASKVEGLGKISAETLNWYLQAFAAFYDWAERNANAPQKLFEGMKVGKAKASQVERLPFKPDAMQAMYLELTQNRSGLVKKESHKWATLIAMFTGARLNEICQLNVADIRKEDEIWIFDVTDEGENQKRVKTSAIRRQVPIHSTLLELGILDFVESRSKGERLFPDYSYSKANGYGRNLGRWFNEK